MRITHSFISPHLFIARGFLVHGTLCLTAKHRPRKHGSIDRVCLGAAATEFLGEHRPELQYLSPHRLVGDIHTALSEQIFAIARREAPLQPNGMPNDRRWELMWARLAAGAF